MDEFTIMPFICLYMASLTRRLSVRHVSSVVVGPDALRQMSTPGDFGARGRVRLTADGLTATGTGACR